MTDLFYGILVFFTVILLVGFLSTPHFNSDFEKLQKYDGYIVVNKNDWLLNEIELRKNLSAKEDTVNVTFNCDDIIYQHLNIGDTIKAEKYKDGDYK